MYRQVLDPVSHSLGLTSIFAVLPLVVLFVLLGVVKMKAQWASLITLAVAIVVALAVYWMPVGQAGDAALEGAAFGFWPIMWIVINALWIYNMSDATGYFAVLRRAFSADLRRPARAGRRDRFLLRRAARGAGRIWDAGRDLRGDAGGPGAESGPSRRRRPGGRHCPRCVRRDRDSDHDTRAGNRPPGRTT